LRLFGLAGEIGSLLAELKKDIREGAASVNTADRVAEELGDILWYVTALAQHAGLGLQKDVLYGNLIKIRDQSALSGDTPAPVTKAALRAGGVVAKALESGVQATTTFNSYQVLAAQTSRYKSWKGLAPFVVRIWSHSAQLLDEFKNGARDGSALDIRKLADALGDVTWYVANIAGAYEIHLDDVAQKNVVKVQSRWPGKSAKATPLFDDNAPELEQLPRKFNVHVVPKNEKTSVLMINGVLVGDPLTDNSWEGDGYRFHDVLHLAHAAILGWSPVLRRMLNRKRKYDSRIDEVEDGARAAIVEEAIAKLIHAYAYSVDPIHLLDSQASVSFDVLKQVKLLTVGLEVDQCQFWEWEKAILSGQKTFNQLRKKKEGVIAIDLNARTIRLMRSPTNRSH
jgi:NTP pyrophosphatase (non-canonical NTP hydrolase)